MQSFPTIVNGFYPLTIIVRLFILDNCGSFRYASKTDFELSNNALCFLSGCTTSGPESILYKIKNIFIYGNGLDWMEHS